MVENRVGHETDPTESLTFFQLRDAKSRPGQSAIKRCSTA